MKIVKLEERRSGKTLGNLLKCLGEAMVNPGEEIIYVDHAVSLGAAKRGIHQKCLKNLKDIVNTLCLQNIDLYISGNDDLIIKSNWRSVFIGDDGFRYQRLF